MNYIISGQEGLIGTFLEKRLTERGDTKVMSVDNRRGFNILNLDAMQLNQDTQPVDMFIHMAAHCKINEGTENPALPHKNNADGIVSILEFCRKHNIPNILTASSSRVLSPERNPYVASKIYLEEMTKAFHDCYGLDFLTFRPSGVYGPGEDKTGRAINNFITSAFKGNNIRIYGDKNKTLDFTYIDDFLDGMQLAMDGPWNEIYNISGDKEVNLTWLAEHIIDEVGSNSKIIHLNAERTQPQRVSVDNSLLRELGYKPKVCIREGIEKMISFYEQNPEAWKNYKDTGDKFYGGKTNAK